MKQSVVSSSGSDLRTEGELIKGLKVVVGSVSRSLVNRTDTVGERSSTGDELTNEVMSITIDRIAVKLTFGR